MKLVLDACVLYPTILREVLLELAGEGGFEPVWSEKILTEWRRAAGRSGAEVEAQAGVEIALLKDRWPKASTNIDNVDLEDYWLPDPDDHHVLAAAVVSGAEGIVTQNLKDFPSRILGGHNLYVRHPDAFLLEAAQTGTLEVPVRRVWRKAEQISGEELVLRNLLKRTGLPRVGRYFQDLTRET